MIDQNTNNDTWNIRKQALEYIMFLKRKQIRTVKAKGCAKGHYCQEYNHEVESISHIIQSYAHMGSCVTNGMYPNYKLWSVIGRKDIFTVNERTWSDTQACATCLWSWMISRALVDYTNIGRINGCILDDVQAPYVSMNDSIGTIASYFHILTVVHPGSNDHLQIRNLIHGNMLSPSSKKQRNWKVSLKNGIFRVDYKMTINMLMKHLYIVVQ